MAVAITHTIQEAPPVRGVPARVRARTLTTVLAPSLPPWVDNNSW